MSFLPNFSNIVHKLGIEVALWNQLKGGLKESNRKRIPVTIDTNTGAFVTAFVAPWDGSVESLIVASGTPTTSTNSAYVTFTVANKSQSDAALMVGDTYVNQTELVANVGAAFMNPAPAMSNGARNPSFKAGEVIEVKGVTTGSPAGYSKGSTFCLLTVTPVDPKASF
jgi:hypothetical protein